MRFGQRQPTNSEKEGIQENASLLSGGKTLQFLEFGKRAFSQVMKVSESNPGDVPPAQEHRTKRKKMRAQLETPSRRDQKVQLGPDRRARENRKNSIDQLGPSKSL